MNDGNRLPRPLLPGMVRVRLATGGEKATFVRDLMAPVLNEYDVTYSDGLAANAAGAELLTVPEPDRELLRFDHEARSELIFKIKRFDRFMRSQFEADTDPILNSWTSCWSPEPGAGDAAFLVWVRESRRGVAQFVLPRVVVNLVSGRVKLRGDQRHPVSAPVSRDTEKTDVTDVLIAVAEVAGSVAWALPLPWGAVATGSLTLFQILLGATKGPTSNPLQDLQEGLGVLIKQGRMRDIASDFHRFADELRAKVTGLSIQVNDIARQGADYFKSLEDWLVGPYGYEQVLNDAFRTLDELPQKSLEDAKLELDLYVTGITLWLLGRKVHMQLLAVKAGAQHDKDDALFFDLTQSWLSHYREIRNLVMGIPDDPGSGFFQVVSGHLDRLSSERLAKISPLSILYVDLPTGAPPSSSQASVTVRGGWSFSDTAEFPQGGHYEYRDEEHSEGCCGPTTRIDARPAAEAARQKHLEEVQDRVDELLSTARDAAMGWKASLDAFAAMLPLPTPVAPRVEPLPDGVATPQGDNWVKGHLVQYAIALKNERGPSGLGPWSEALEVGDTAFARVTLPLPPPAFEKATVHVRRRFHTKGVIPDSKDLGRLIKIVEPEVRYWDDSGL